MAETKRTARKPVLAVDQDTNDGKKPSAVKCTIHFEDGTSKDYSVFMASVLRPTETSKIKIHGVARDIQKMTDQSECASFSRVEGDMDMAETILVANVLQLHSVMEDMPDELKALVMIKARLANLTGGVILGFKRPASARHS